MFSRDTKIALSYSETGDMPNPDDSPSLVFFFLWLKLIEISILLSFTSQPHPVIQLLNFHKEAFRHLPDMLSRQCWCFLISVALLLLFKANLLSNFSFCISVLPEHLMLNRTTDVDTKYWLNL